MNNQAPSRRASNHSISLQSTSLLSRALAVGSRAPSFLLRIIAVSERDGKEGETGKKGVGTSKDKERAGDERARSRGRTGVRARDYCRFPDWQSNCAGILLISCRWQGAYYEKRKLITATAPSSRSATCIDRRASRKPVPGYMWPSPDSSTPLALAIDLCWWNRVRARE